MDPIYRVRKSRDQWKEKATQRADELREGRKKSRRQSKRVKELEKKLSELNRENEDLKKKFR
jgi:uncharacterized coiled-coil DUF342 family protein